MKCKQYILLLLLYCASLNFTLVFAQPTIIGFTPTNAPVGSLVTITGTNLSNSTAIRIAGNAAIPISNNGTTVVAMVMPGASSGTVNIYTSSDSAKSADIFTVSTLESKKVQQGNKLVGIDTIGAANQGWSVAISADGNTAIIGGYNDNTGAGAAWIYTRNNGTWAPQGTKLVGNGATGKAQQGRSVAISADGNTVLIGGNLDSNYIGAAWVFTRNGNAWTQQGKKLVGTGSVGLTQQGQSVSLSADGNTAIIGGNSDNGGAGAAWVFARNGATWIQQGSKLIGAGAVGSAEQGQSVCISADGNTAIVGGNGDNNGTGAAWIFTKTNGVWAQQGNKLVGTGGSTNARQGWSVAINADGNTAIIGGIYDNNFTGAVWVFTRTGVSWLQQGAKLIGNGTVGVAQQGFSLSLSADGNTALIGGFGDNGIIGAAWIFTRSILGVWSQQGNKLVGTGAVGSSRQGQSVALSADGNTAIVGGHEDNGNAGASWVYTFVSPPTITSISPQNVSVGSLVTITGSNFVNPLTVNIGGKAAILISNNERKLVAMVMPGAISGVVTVTTTGGTPSIAGSINIIPNQAPKSQQGNKLVGSGAIGKAQQGLSVAVSADGNTAIVGGSTDKNEVGAAWIYIRNNGVWNQQGSKLVGDSSTSGGIIQSSQGQSVAISADGNTAIVGGYNDNGGIGAAWVYTRNQLGVWTQQGKKLVGSGGSASTRLGYAVALSADGNTAIVGGSGDNGGVGAVWVFTRSSDAWVQQGNKLVGSGGTTDARQGYAVSLSADGNTILVGGYNDNGGIGAAWVFTKTTNGWIQQGNKLVGTGAIGNASQGFTVSLNADGNTAMVGGYLDNVGVGAAWVYERNSSGVWSQQGNKLVATGFIGIPSLGRSVSLSADGNTAMVGGYGDNGNAGAAWFFSRNDNTWLQQGDKLVGSGGSSDARQGFSVTMSADGFTALMGGYLDNNQTGAAWAFTYVPPPTIINFSPKSGPVGTLITITGNNFLAPSTINIGGIAAIPISNDGNSLVVMAMPGTSTGSVSLVTIGGSVTSIGSFSITQIQAPNIQQGNKLISADARIGKEQLGYSVAISADGNTAIVGGSNDDGGKGAAWIFSRTAGIWMQQGNKLIGSGAAGNAQQGQSVAIGADGNTAIVGGYNDNNGIGATWVFIRTASGWIQQGSKLVGTGAVNNAANQGYSVAISADGNKAIIGGLSDNKGTGAAWIFSRTNGIWSQQKNKLVGTGSKEFTKLGHSVAISADGKTALVGGPTDNIATGATWVFIDNNGTWEQQGDKLVGTGVVGIAQQGSAVWLNADGNTAIVGGSSDNGGIGAAWIFTRTNGTWAQQGDKLVGTGAVGNAQQGHSVSISADGNTATIGGNTDSSGAGAAWVFSRLGGIWSQQGKKLFGRGSVGSSNQGQSVAISADGITAIVGGHLDNAQAGAVWVYTYVSPPIINNFSPSSGPIGSLITITGTHLLNTTSIKIGGVDALPISNDGNTLVIMVMPRTISGVINIATAAGAVNAGNFTVTATQAPNEQQGNKLVGTGGIGSTQQGYSVAVSADGNTAILGGYSDNNFAGAAWIFSRTGGVWAQQGGKLVGTEGSTTAQQGWSVAINADGNTVIVGGYNDKGGVGAAWIFTRNGGVWAQQGNKLVGTGIEGLGNAQQGQSVSLSADGNTAIVGGSGDNFLTGAAWVFTRQNGVWIQQGNKLVGTGSIGNARQGQSVSISSNGRTAVVGGHNDNGGVGAAWVHTLSAGTWTQQGNKLIGIGAIGNAQQGYSVAINADGNTAIIGGQTDNGGIGAAWVFTRGAGAIWTQQMKLVGNDTIGLSAQGQSVSISADGNTAMVGGSGDKNNAGAAWLFTRSGSVWAQRGNKLFGTGAVGNARQGFSLSLSADGNTAISGGYVDNNSVGASWAYNFNPPSSITTATYNASTAMLAVTGINFVANPGNLNDIEVSRLIITGEGNSSYTLTSNNVDITNTTSFSVKLNTTDSAAVNQILNKNGASSTDATVYNLGADNFWMSSSIAGSADLNDNPIIVTNVSVPSITSATYNIVTGLLSVKATGLLKRSGASNDIDVTKLTITGQGGTKVTLTTNTANAEISDATSFTLSLGAADKILVNALLNRSGNSSIDGTTYNLSAADDWNTGADLSINISDTLNNTISVNGLPEIVTIVPLSATSISTVYGTASGALDLSVAGSFLQGGILVTAPINYEVSLDTITFNNVITVGAAGTVLSTKVFVRLKSGLSVGTYSGNIILSSINAPNIILATIIGNVTPKELTISGIIANNKAFDGNAIATVIGRPILNGLLNADTATVRLAGVPLATFSRSAIGNNLTVTVVGYTLTGAAASNYTLKLPIELKANIFDADVTIMPNPFFSELTIQLNVAATSNTSTTTVRLLGLSGKEFKSVTVARGVNRIVLYGAELLAGVYLLEIKNNRYQQTRLVYKY